MTRYKVHKLIAIGTFDMVTACRLPLAALLETSVRWKLVTCKLCLKKRKAKS